MPYQTIANREARVKGILANRTDLAADIRNWLGDAYLEIGSGYDFEDLEASYEDMTVVNIDAYDLQANVRAIKSVVLIDPSSGQVILPDGKNIQYIRRIATVQNGVPSVYALYGSQIVFRPKPNKSYTLLVDYWKRPELATVVQDTELLMPTDWLEVLDMAAAMRGYMGKLQDPAKGGALHTFIFGGYNQAIGRKIPGMIKERQSRQQASAQSRNYAIQPRTSTYTGGR